jgi:hypothetical protein
MDDDAFRAVDQEVNYYEPSYEPECLGLKRYMKNLIRQSLAVKTNVVVAFGMAAIEIFEFLATLKITVLLTIPEYDTILAWTLYTYLFLFVFKFIDLAWLVFTQWNSQKISMPTKVAQFLSLWTFCNFLPYGEFFVDLGYKVYITRE